MKNKYPLRTNNLLCQNGWLCKWSDESLFLQIMYPEIGLSEMGACFEMLHQKLWLIFALSQIKYFSVFQPKKNRCNDFLTTMCCYLIHVNNSVKFGNPTNGWHNKLWMQEVFKILGLCYKPRIIVSHSGKRLPYKLSMFGVCFNIKIWEDQILLFNWKLVGVRFPWTKWMDFKLLLQVQTYRKFTISGSDPFFQPNHLKPIGIGWSLLILSLTFIPNHCKRRESFKISRDFGPRKFGCFDVHHQIQQ